MFKFNQKGIVHLIPLLIILAGIIAGVYLVQHTQIFKPKADVPPTGPEYAKWLTQMQAMGVYPAEEDGEIILYNRKTFVEKYCQPNPCYLNPSSFEELSSAIDKDKEFIHALGNKLRENDFAPIQVLESYFPEIKAMDNQSLGGALQALEPICRGGVEPICVPELKTYISEEELTKLINQLATERAWEEKDPIKNFITVTNPIFGIRSLVDVITLPPHKVSDEDRLNAIFGFTIIYGLTERVAAKGIQITTDAAINLSKMIQDVGPVRKSVLAGEPVAFDALGNLAPGWLIRKSAPTRPNSVVARAEQWFGKRHILPEPQFKPGTFVQRAGPPPLPKNPHALDSFNKTIRLALESGRGALISRTDVLRPIAGNVKNAIASFEARTGRGLSVDRLTFDRAIEDGTMYAVEDSFLSGIGAGYTHVDMIVMGYGRYFSERGIGSMHHEMFHLIGGGAGKSKGWIYGGTFERDKTLTAIYELMTDAWADLAMGQRIMSQGSHIATGGYAGNNPHIIDALFNRLFRFNPQLLDDFLEFAITGDADQLVARFGGYEQFLAHFRQKGINFNAVSYTAVGAAALSSFEGDESVAIDPIIDIDADFIQDVPEESPTSE